MTRLQIAAQTGDACITIEQGEPLYEQVFARLRAGDSVTMDFRGVQVFASPFFNAAVGRLLKDFSIEDFRNRVIVEGLTPVGIALMERVIENSNRFYHDPAARKAIEDILNEEVGDGADTDLHRKS